MSDAFVGEIRMFGGNFAPLGWMFCEGQILPIAEAETLFQLIGTTYGGDGQSTFALPDLRGRLPVHQGTGASGITRTLAESEGTETVTLSVAQMPAHVHPLAATGAATVSTPLNMRYGATGASATYLDTMPTSAFATGSHLSAGGNQPHSNLMPALCVHFIISLFGIFPSQT